MGDWVLIDYDYKEKLPKADCEIWITRVCFAGERWVQKVSFYADGQDIDWDGTIAWMVAEKDEDKPEACDEIYTRTIQSVR